MTSPPPPEPTIDIATAATSLPRVGRRLDSAQNDDRRMIQLVKERPTLYMRNNQPVAGYYAEVKTMWQEVSDCMGWTVAEVRRKWSHIRNSYSRHLRNEATGATTGRGRHVSRWYLADSLEFLREHMATDTCTSPRRSPYSRDVKREHSPNTNSSIISNGHFLSPFEISMREPDESSCGSQGFRSDENSSFFSYFRGIYDEFSELSPNRQRRFKRICLEELHRLMEEQEMDQGEPSICAIGTFDAAVEGEVEIPFHEEGTHE